MLRSTLVVLFASWASHSDGVRIIKRHRDRASHEETPRKVNKASWKRTNRNQSCPGILGGTPFGDKDDRPPQRVYDNLIKHLDIDAVKKDMAMLLKDSRECWPADQGNYAGLMIRLAWHCSGSYRAFDGVGGCTGGRIRFEPERSWEDNQNLDKARALLVPLKKKYGDALSWGDLIILAGTTAYRQAGAPITRMCFGRRDEKKGKERALLGPTKVQEEKFPCKVQGACEDPLPTTLGLIYVNPAGPMGKPDPKGSAREVRRTFETMGHTDRATVALVGGGHAIGKCHGACSPGSGGLHPDEAFRTNQPIAKGTCGTGEMQGKGYNTFTSGFEGYWTTTPFTWSNEYFRYLRDETWEVYTGPGGQPQWRMARGGSDLMRLTSDMALLEDESYRRLVDEFADNMTALDEAFDSAWDILTTNGNGVWSENAVCDDGSAPPTTRLRMRSDDAYDE